MWRDPRPESYLDRLATEHLRKHGHNIPAEPGSQIISWIGHRRKTAGSIKSIPLAAFFDVPKAPKSIVGKWGQVSPWGCDGCGAPLAKAGPTICKRCRKRTTRANFIEKWNRRSGNAASLLDAILVQSGWEGPEGGAYRVVISPLATALEEFNALREAFADAIERNAEPEEFRQILLDAGLPEFVEARDARIVAQKDRFSRHAKIVNAKRWADPEQRERMSEHNRRQWKDDTIRARRIAGNKASKATPEYHARASEMRRQAWQDPELREKMTSRMRETKNTPEMKAKFSKQLADRWQDPILRPKYLAAVRASAKKRGDQIRGLPQSPEQIAARVEAGRRTRAARGPIKQTADVVRNRVEKTVATKAAKRAERELA